MITSTYDSINQLSGRTSSRSGEPTVRLDISYDGYGQLDSISRFTTGSLVSGTEYGYDLNGRATRVHHMDA